MSMGYYTTALRTWIILQTVRANSSINSQTFLTFTELCSGHCRHRHGLQAVCPSGIDIGPDLVLELSDTEMASLIVSFSRTSMT